MPQAESHPAHDRRHWIGDVARVLGELALILRGIVEGYLELEERIRRRTLDIITLAFVVPEKHLGQSIVCEVLVVRRYVCAGFGVLKADHLTALDRGSVKKRLKVAEGEQSELALRRAAVDLVAGCVHIGRHAEIYVWHYDVFEAFIVSYALSI